MSNESKSPEVEQLRAEVKKLRELAAENFYRVEALKLLVPNQPEMWAMVERVATRLRAAEG